MVEEGLPDGHQFSPVDGEGVFTPPWVDEEGESMSGGVDPSPHTGGAFDSEEAPISVVSS